MDFSELIRRTDLYAIETYLLFGSEELVIPPEESYSKRLEAAEKKTYAFFDARYSNVKEYDEISGYFCEQTEVYKDVYFEIGLILGAKIAFQIGRKLEELT